MNFSMTLMGTDKSPLEKAGQGSHGPGARQKPKGTTGPTSVALDMFSCPLADTPAPSTREEERGRPTVWHTPGRSPAPVLQAQPLCQAAPRGWGMSSSGPQKATKPLTWPCQDNCMWGSKLSPHTAG